MKINIAVFSLCAAISFSAFAADPATPTTAPAPEHQMNMMHNDHNHWNEKREMWRHRREQCHMQVRNQVKAQEEALRKAWRDGMENCMDKYNKDEGPHHPMRPGIHPMENNGPK